VHRSRRDPETEVRWNHPQILAGGDLHHAAGCINELIRSVHVLGNIGSA
jgi:hypothetical protein